jgi:hypothetical protein
MYLILLETQQKRYIITKCNEWKMAIVNGWLGINKGRKWLICSANLLNLNVHFSIPAIVVLKIKHTEECAIIHPILHWHGDIRESPVRNIRE